MEITVRRATVDDTAAIWDFMKVAYERTAKYKLPERWNWQFRDNPFVEPNAEALPIWIAVTDGQIVGQTCAIPVDLNVAGETHRAVWGADLIVLPAWRGQGIGRRLSKAIIEHSEIYLAFSMAPATRHIYETLGYTNCDPVTMYKRLIRIEHERVLRWLTLRLQRVPRLQAIARVGCRVFQFHRISALAGNLALGVRNLLEGKAKASGRTEIRAVERFGHDIDQLWEATRHQYELIVCRNRRFLNWRIAANKYLRYRPFVAVRDGETRGYIILRKREPIEMVGGVIVDLYAARDDRETLEDLIRHALRVFGNEVPVIECATSPGEYREVLSAFGFREREKHVPVYWCRDRVLNARLESLRSRWFLSKADQDWDQLAPI